MLSTKCKIRIKSIVVLLAMLFNFANVSPALAADSTPSIVYVAHGGGNVGAAHGGEIGTINLSTFAYTPLTGSLGSLTSLVSDGTTLYTYEVQNNRILGVNPTSGAIVSSVQSNVEFTDMAYNPTTGAFYGVGTDSQLYRVNISTGVASFISSTPGWGAFGRLLLPLTEPSICTP